jgi:hypothetical protein
VIVRKKNCALHLALTAFCVLALLGSPAYGQGKGKDKDTDDNDEATEHHEGLVQDWSHHHAVYPRVGPIQSLIKVQNDPRAIQSWQAAARSDWRRWNHKQSHHAAMSGMHPDWSISLGAGTTAQFMYPAKFGFNVSAAPDCANDFVVFPVNAPGSSSQPNIVAFKNLYSGTVGGTGICNAPLQGRTAGANDDGVSATTLWSYNVNAVGGKVATSPVLSFDGSKVAFVETNASGPAHFHVLAWKSGDGVIANLQTVTSPATINSSTPFSAFAPSVGFGGGAASDLALGSSGNDTNSSPFFEYGIDRAYVGNDAGTLFRIKNVFCLYSGCTGNGFPAPSLDGTWGTGGALNVGGTCANGKLTGPVVDGSSGNVFVGCSDGKLYGFTNTGTPLTPLIVGNGSATGGIVDSPIVDGVHGFVYAVSGNNGVNAVMVQAKTSDLSLQSTALLGTGGVKSLHAPAFNDAYYSNGTSTNWLLYEVAPASTGITVYGVAFNGSRIMTSGTPTNALSFNIGNTPQEISPLTEFMTTGGEDRFFESLQSSASGNLASFRIDLGFPIAGPNAPESFATEGTGTTGIVVDNVASGTAQANSIYFGALGSNTAVKLTQGTLK